MTRVLHVVVGRVDLDRARERVVEVRVLGAEAARVHLPHVERGDALHEPLRDELAHAAGAGEAVRAEAGGHPEPAHGCRPEDELAVGGERLRAVDEPNHLRVGELRNAHDGVLHQLLEARPVLVEQPAVEVGRNAVEPPGRRMALVAAHDEAAGLASEVDEQRGIAHRRDVERHAVRLRDQVLVRHRDDRHRHARQAADLAGEHAARVDDDVGLDRAGVGLDARHAPALDADCRDPRRRENLGATAAGAFRKRERQLARIDVAVGGQVGGAEHAVLGHRRKELPRALGGDELERQPERLRPAGLASQLLHPLFRRREPQRPDLVPAGVETDLLAERPVEVDRGHHHLREAQRAAQLADEPRRVERRAARQVGALDEHDVVPAQPRQPVEDRAATDAAADDDGPRASSHPSASRKRWSVGRPLQAVEVRRRVPREVEVELRDALLDDAPHRLAEVGHEAHQRQRSGIAAAVTVEQRSLAVRIQLVVDGEVREVEVRVAHAGVLPVDDPRPLAVVDEVQGEEVVVARHQRAAAARGLDAVGDVEQLLVLGRNLHATLASGRRVRLDHAKHIETGGQDGSARMQLAEQAAGLVRIRIADRAFHEPRHEAAVLEADDFGADAELRREQRRLVLVLPVDAQQLRVLPADAEHERLTAHRDLEVVIRDAAAERLDVDAPPRATSLRRDGRRPTRARSAALAVAAGLGDELLEEARVLAVFRMPQHAQRERVATGLERFDRAVVGARHHL